MARPSNREKTAETQSHVDKSSSRGGGARFDWWGVARLTARQHGVVSLSQLRACGLTTPGASALARAGRLHRIHRGVYALSPAALSGEGRRMAAVLACGSGALLGRQIRGGASGTDRERKLDHRRHGDG